VRLEDERLCTLVLIGARADGQKELIAVEDGYRESAESWKTVLRDLKRRGMQAPVLAVGDGALGFWEAVREVWPATREQRDWCHKIANVLDKLPKRLQGRAKRALHEIMYAETRAQAERGIEAFVAEFSPKYERAVDCLIKDSEALLAFFDFPAEHWKHLRTSNPIESSFATVRLRQRVTKGAGSRAKALTMAFKLLMLAKERWRKLNGSHLLLRRVGVRLVGSEPKLQGCNASMRYRTKCANDPVDELQDGCEQLRMCSEQQAKRDRKREHPLPHRHPGDDVIDQVGGGLRHAPGATARAEAAACN
jgi:putative transposase